MSKKSCVVPVVAGSPDESQTQAQTGIQEGEAERSAEKQKESADWTLPAPTLPLSLLIR